MVIESNLTPFAHGKVPSERTSYLNLANSPELALFLLFADNYNKCIHLVLHDAIYNNVIPEQTPRVTADNDVTRTEFSEEEISEDSFQSQEFRTPFLHVFNVVISGLILVAYQGCLPSMSFKSLIASISSMPFISLSPICSSFSFRMRNVSTMSSLFLSRFNAA